MRKLQPAMRVTGVLILVVLVGWFLSVTGAVAQTGGTKVPTPAILELTFDQALERALSANEGLKVVQEQVRETQGRVEEAKTNFLPSVNLNFLCTPAQRFPLMLERARQELRYRVVETFYAALMNEESVRVADEQIALAGRQLELANARFAAGSVARLDVLQAEVELANSKARRIQAKAGVDTAYQSLRTVLSLRQASNGVTRDEP